MKRETEGSTARVDEDAGVDAEPDLAFPRAFLASAPRVAGEARGMRTCSGETSGCGRTESVYHGAPERSRRHFVVTSQSMHRRAPRRCAASAPSKSRRRSSL